MPLIVYQPWYLEPYEYPEWGPIFATEALAREWIRRNRIADAAQWDVDNYEVQESLP